MNVTFFSENNSTYAVQSENKLAPSDIEKLEWLLEAKLLAEPALSGEFIGPRREMITPWSTNATDICVNVGLVGIQRIEIFRPADDSFDPMLEERYRGLNVNSLHIERQPEAVRQVTDIRGYNKEAGLALSEEEIVYLERASQEMGRPLTDSELFGFGQINSEHCRHKIFNGEFIIDGQKKSRSLFTLIKDTANKSPGQLISAYKDNVAFMRGPRTLQFAPVNQDRPSEFKLRDVDVVLSLKAETHNFPTTVEPFFGASTGSGGEIRDRMAGGQGSIPLTGSAVYMTAYPRLKGSRAAQWEKATAPRKWKYQTPLEILIKASNGASDFGNKFGQPLIVGSLLTFEGTVGLADGQQMLCGYDRTVMLAGGVGYAARDQALKQPAQKGDVLVMLGGDNYRIGMAGSSVSSVDTGANTRELELSAVQRANPEMQKRVFNVIRALAENSVNPILLIHDHGAGGHLNCFSELLEEVGGRIDLDKLPVGDPTLSAREILSNESQERMGLIVRPETVPLLEKLCKRERAAMYVVGEVTGDKRLQVVTANGRPPIDVPLKFFFGSSPKTVLEDRTIPRKRDPLQFVVKNNAELLEALKQVLSLEGVASKDWLTNKVDRSVTGRVAQQQTVGPRQLPLANLGVAALDYSSNLGIATSIGHAPVAGLLDERAGSVLSIAEALTNIVWAPLTERLASVVLSANWMWPAKQPGEDARLYSAVEAASQFAQALGIAIPTGKDSLSMTMKYSDQAVRAPGTVIMTASAQCSDIRGVVTPVLREVIETRLIYVNLCGDKNWPLGGSSFAQTLSALGAAVPQVDPKIFSAAFNVLQELIGKARIISGHDVSSGGLITTLCEMAFAGDLGVKVTLPTTTPEQMLSMMFSEKPGVVLQVKRPDMPDVMTQFRAVGAEAFELGTVGGDKISVQAGALGINATVKELLEVWMKPSVLLDSHQVTPALAEERGKTILSTKLNFIVPRGFTGRGADYNIYPKRKTAGLARAAIIREKGTNGDREMAMALFAAGFDVIDVTMSDLMAGRETLDSVQFVVFPGGFSNSDVLGSARGWAGAFRYNDRARAVLEKFYARKDTLSLGVCNGCQLVTALGLLYPDHKQHPRMLHNASGKFESIFLNVSVQETASVLLKPLVGTKLGIWVAHGEGRFDLPEGEKAYDLPLRYSSAAYPANPNGSPFNAAGICSKDGRHLAMMPHLERSLFPWNWGEYLNADTKRTHDISPWALVFAAAREWVLDFKKEAEKKEATKIMKREF